MTDYETILAALAEGTQDDATVAAALDCYQEQCNCTLLAAVIEVARVVTAHRDAKEMATAQAHLDRASPICRALRLRVMRQCLNIADGMYTWILVTAGEERPLATVSLDSGSHHQAEAGCILVGARWVIREAERIARVRAAANKWRERRHSR